MRNALAATARPACPISTCDDRATILKGGKRGPAIVPGNADESLLYKAVRREGELQMPPGKAPLAPSEVSLHSRLDQRRRNDRQAGPPRPAPSWWSFRKPVRPAVPAVKNAAWVRNPIDAFHPSEARAEGSAPRAGSRPPDPGAPRLLRSCTGCRPRRSRWSNSSTTQSPDAYEKLIDRLLASPRYGERWGRHWLDLVRYADTSGFETDHFFLTAWRYRDYVIESFNRDKPYDDLRAGADRGRRAVVHQHGAGRDSTSCRRRRRRMSIGASARACSRSARFRSSSPTTAISFAPNGRPTRWTRSARRFSD